MDRSHAAVQLCAPPWTDGAAGGAEIATPEHRPASRSRADEDPRSAPRCEEQQLYRCDGGAVIDCTSRRVVAACPRGCFAEGAFIADGVSREAAFAILCSR